MIRVGIIASNLALRAGLRALFGAAERVKVVGESESLTGLERLLPETDVLVYAATGIDETFLPGLQDILVDSETYPALLVLADSFNPGILANLPLRAWGLLPLDSSAEELAAAVGALQEGLLVGAHQLLGHLFERLFRAENRLEMNHIPGPFDQSFADPLEEPLTARETEVLQLLAQGLANKQIAAGLAISEHTVKFHVSSIYAKLGASNRTEAVSIGARRGLILL